MVAATGAFSVAAMILRVGPLGVRRAAFHSLNVGAHSWSFFQPPLALPRQADKQDMVGEIEGLGDVGQSCVALHRVE